MIKKTSKNCNIHSFLIITSFIYRRECISLIIASKRYCILEIILPIPLLEVDKYFIKMTKLNVVRLKLLPLPILLCKISNQYLQYFAYLQFAISFGTKRIYTIYRILKKLNCIWFISEKSGSIKHSVTKMEYVN